MSWLTSHIFLAFIFLWIPTIVATPFPQYFSSSEDLLPANLASAPLAGVSTEPDSTSSGRLNHVAALPFDGSMVLDSSTNSLNILSDPSVIFASLYEQQASLPSAQRNLLEPGGSSAVSNSNIIPSGQVDFTGNSDSTVAPLNSDPQAQSTWTEVTQSFHLNTPNPLSYSNTQDQTNTSKVALNPGIPQDSQDLAIGDDEGIGLPLPSVGEPSGSASQDDNPQYQRLEDFVPLLEKPRCEDGKHNFCCEKPAPWKQGNGPPINFDLHVKTRRDCAVCRLSTLITLTLCSQHLLSQRSYIS